MAKICRNGMTEDITITAPFVRSWTRARPNLLSRDLPAPYVSPSGPVRPRSYGERASQAPTQDQATNESIQISATAGAMAGSAASKKQPTFEQFSLVDMITLRRRDDPASAPAAVTT